MMLRYRPRYLYIIRNNYHSPAVLRDTTTTTTQQNTTHSDDNDEDDDDVKNVKCKCTNDYSVQNDKSLRGH